jgi:glycosyltransferase involved in cell wall biosynthesis
MPYIITVHDLIRYLDLKGYGAYIHHPNLRDRFYLNLDYKGIKKAMRIIAPSQATKKDLMRHLKIPEESILVVYEGVDCEVFKPAPHRRLNSPYILFVGSEHPRKNLPVLLRAFKELKQSGQFSDLKLVKVGRAGGREADFRKQTLRTVRDLGLEKEVIFTDHVAEEELVSYYSAAECFILPSLYEGFGLPLLEAMGCGCPIIASNSSSLPEIAGDAALLFSPHDSDELARLTHLVITKPELRAQLVGKGLDRAKSFPWERTAQQTLQVYRSVEKEVG